MKILVILPNWYGEVLFTTPFLKALRLDNPSAEIVAFGWPKCREVLVNNPNVSDFIEFDEENTHRGFFKKLKIINLLRAKRFDSVYILRKSLSRTLISVLAGIKERCGFDNKKSGWLLTRRITPVTGKIHKADTYLRLLGRSRDGVCEFFLSESECQSARLKLSQLLGNNDEQFAVIHPGANWSHKRWSSSRFAKLADQLITHNSLKAVITGGPDDKELVDAIESEMLERPIKIVGETTIRELAAILSFARVLITNDTGVLHIAVAVDCPSVALYGPTDPAITGPLGKSARVISHSDACPEIPCFNPDYPPHPGMSSISVDEVSSAVTELLGQRV